MLKKYLTDFLSIVFPDTCYYCDVALVEGESNLCLRCYLDIPVQQFHLQPTNPLVEMVAGLVQIDGAYCYMKFNQHGVAQKLLHELKYKGKTAIGLSLGEWFGRYIMNDLKSEKVDGIVPIPLHKAKARKRGFNQSEIIADGMSRVTGIPVLNDVLIRTKNITSQTKKGKVDRWNNTTSIYEIPDKNRLADKSILLLDDVITTGATIGAALEALAQSGVRKLYFGCIASGK